MLYGNNTDWLPMTVIELLNIPTDEINTIKYLSTIKNNDIKNP